MNILITISVMFCILSVYIGLATDFSNENGEYRSSILVFVFGALFGIFSTFTIGYNDVEKAYKQGQVDFQQGKIKYKVEIKLVADTTITVLK